MPVCQCLSPSEKVIHKVAERKGVDELDLEPLHSAVDPDALDELFSSSSASIQNEGSVAFPYAGYEVVVHANGHVEIESE